MPLVAIGRVLRAHGVRGELRALAYGDTLPSLGGGEIVSAVPRVTSSAARALTVSEVRPTHGHEVLLSLREITSREEAAALGGHELMVARDRLPPLEEDEYYAGDLVGLEVVTPEGAVLGRVEGLLELAPHDVLVVTDEGREVLLPLIEDVIRSVDLAEGRIVAAPFAADAAEGG